MKTVESRNATSSVNRKTAPFFSKESDQHFFGSAQNEQPFFPSSKSRTSFIQAKLNIGQPNDHFEKEADSIADKVVQHSAEPAAIRNRSFSPASVMPFSSKNLPAMKKKKKFRNWKKKILRQEERNYSANPFLKAMQNRPMMSLRYKRKQTIQLHKQEIRQLKAA